MTIKNKKKNTRAPKARIMLSICMIVKDEGEILASCLDALVSLRKNVACELIVTDTGSTDDTVAIAEQYADKVLSFPWCNDFAAARNYGLQQARGEWFMYLDADECFKDTKEIEQFFLSGEYQRYCSATFIVRSYTGAGEYGDLDLLRMHRRGPRNVFQGAIHEYIAWENPRKVLNSIAEHSGYERESIDKKQKHQRNLSLLLEARVKEPNSLHVLTHLIKQYESVNDYDQVITCIEEGIALTERTKVKSYLPFLYHHRVMAYYQKKDWEAIKDTIAAYFAYKQQTSKEIWGTDLEMYGIEVIRYSMADQYQEAAEAGKNYCLVYDRLQDPQFRSADMFFDVLPMKQAQWYKTILQLIIEALVKLREASEALGYYDRIAIGGVNDYNNVISLIAVAGEYERLPKLFGHCHNADDEQIYFAKLDGMISKLSQPERVKIWTVLSEMAQSSDRPYFQMAALCLADAEHDALGMQRILDELLNRADIDWSVLYADVYYVMLKNNRDFSGLSARLDIEDAGFFANKIAAKYDDGLEVAVGYFTRQNDPAQPAELDYWAGATLERYLLTTEPEDTQAYLRIFAQYIKALGQYMHKTYRAELLAEQQIKAIPRVYRFIYQMEQAEQALKSDHPAGYLQHLQKALQGYPPMKAAISLLTDAFEQQRTRQANTTDVQGELAQYMAQVKRNIEVLISAEHYREAESLLTEYRDIMPDDPDIALLSEQIRQSELVLH